MDGTDVEDLPLEPKDGRSVGGDDPDDPINNPAVVSNPRIVMHDKVREAWMAAQAIRSSNEERALLGVYAELLDAGDVDRAMAVYDRIIKLRGHQLEVMGIPKRPTRENKRPNSGKMRAAMPVD